MEPIENVVAAGAAVADAEVVVDRVGEKEKDTDVEMVNGSGNGNVDVGVDVGAKKGIVDYSDSETASGPASAIDSDSDSDSDGGGLAGLGEFFIEKPSSTIFLMYESGGTAAVVSAEAPVSRVPPPPPAPTHQDAIHPLNPPIRHLPPPPMVVIPLVAGPSTLPITRHAARHTKRARSPIVEVARGGADEEPVTKKMKNELARERISGPQQFW